MGHHFFRVPRLFFRPAIAIAQSTSDHADYLTFLLIDELAKPQAIS
jgi:hypothetical protein